MLSKILLISWNVRCLYFSSYLPFRMFTSNFSFWHCYYFWKYFLLIPSSTFLPSSNFSFNLITSSFIALSCSSSTWSSSLFWLSYFSRSTLRNTILASIPSQYSLDSTWTWSMLSYASNLFWRLIIHFKEKSIFV